MENISKPVSNRLQSLDALRGFDMLWIMGGKHIFLGLATLTGWPVFQWWAGQVKHTAWHGFTFYDIIFPLFLFLAGISFPFSVAKRRANGQTNRQIYKHIFTRAILLFLFGLIYNGLFRFDGNLRVASVLARIGFAWMFAAIIFINTERISIRLIWSFGLLILYSLIFALVPAPDAPAGTDIFSAQGNFIAWFDRMFLPGRLNDEIFDPEGILGLVPAVPNALFGMMAGTLLLSERKYSPGKKSLYMLIAGIIFILAAILFNPVIPIIKKMWTPTFVFVTVGIGLILLSFFYWVIDIKNCRKWAFPFRVIGMNSITIYLGQKIINFGFIRDFFFAGIAARCSKGIGDLVLSCAYVFVCWIFLYLLYRKKIFFKV